MRLLYFIIPLIFILACKKEPIQYKFEGMVTDKNSNQPIANVLIKVSQKKVNLNALNPNYIFIDEIITDASGQYAISFDREKILDIKFELENDKFYKFEQIINASDLETKNTNEYNFKIESKAWAKIRLVNSFVLSGEQFNFYKHNVKEGCLECCTNDYTIAYDTNPDTTFTCPVVGNMYFKYSYGETLALTSVTDSTYCPENDTTEILIVY